MVARCCINVGIVVGIVVITCWASSATPHCQQTRYKRNHVPMDSLEDLAVAALLALHRHSARSVTAIPAIKCSAFLCVRVLTVHGYINGSVKNLVHSRHLFRGTFHIHGAHFLCDGFPLLLSDGRQALRFEELDARALVSEV